MLSPPQAGRTRKGFTYRSVARCDAGIASRNHTPATFTSVQVAPSTELVYRFNLQPVGEGRTLPERRPDRNDPKWRIRASQSSRSIFNAGDAADETVRKVEAAEEEEAARDDVED